MPSRSSKYLKWLASRGESNKSAKHADKGRNDTKSMDGTRDKGKDPQRCFQHDQADSCDGVGGELVDAISRRVMDNIAIRSVFSPDF